ncbi:RagB/SusD family nutrient uptake outer membrane protein [Chitinophaga arvensicola]|uniref:Starch-binding associating with outer membrane n=1 Tax=Chitinophaga arvensicola TaxID=29529 RepID=A0A1I0SBS3_9BACT|nr:RagB/SusD family nutrient uptake outer membrane protein [Chitinophaga arvensicola]SEW54302.1 Starch-binding associating with outer membrane [Chitinophaga arvensicola]
MKRKSFKYIIALAASMQLLSACSNKFLDVSPKGNFLESNYYQNQTQAFNGLIAAYDVLGWKSGGFVTKIGVLDAASDDHFAGGGSSTDIMAYQAVTTWSALTPATGPQDVLWQKGFAGVFRVNTLLAKLPGVPMDENLKKRYAAEAKILRAYYYFDLVLFFRNIPLLTAPVNTADMYKVPQAAPADVYKQIEADLKEAIAETNLPDAVDRKTEGGRVTRGTAHALLGKVYLFQEKWTDAANELKEVNGGTPGETSAKYGYKLVPDFASLWKSDAASKFNTESIFEISYNSTSGGTWETVPGSEGNILNIIVGPRDYVALSPNAGDYVSGWSFLVITKELFNVIHYDPRYNATVLNMDSLRVNKIAKYDTTGYANTGYFLNKFAGRKSNIGVGGNAELNFPQNTYEIRLADTYLMEAEASVRAGGGSGAGTRAYQLLAAVRARVGLGPIDATIDNIFKERRLELAGEGHRFWDIVRTKQAETLLNAQKRPFVAGKNEILPLPLLELPNTQLKQNDKY